MNLDLLKNDVVINHLIKKRSRLTLTGGAVVDILEGRTPKDYDFTSDILDINYLLSIEGITFCYSSITSISFKLFDKYKIQLLRKNVEDFPFTIEQATYNLLHDRLTINKCSFENKILIPNHKVYTTSKRPSRKEFRLRVKKWESKGYKINPITYKSYLNVCKRNNIFSIFEKYDS